MNGGLKSLTCILGLALGLVSSSTWADLDVRVRRNAAGVPQLQVNGQAVPPRMFWGEEGGDPLVAGDAWTDFTYTFSSFDDMLGTVHIRFGSGNAGRVEFRDLHVTDVETGEEFAGAWTAFPYKYADNFALTNGLLTVEVPEKLSGEDFHVYTVRRTMHRGSRFRLTGSVRADATRVIKFGAYLVGPGSVHESMTLIGNDPFPREIAQAAAAGVDFVSYMVPKHVWTDDETYDFSELDRISDKILSANPNAKLVPRIKIETCWWWVRQHPEHQIVYDDGSKPGIPCISSRLYREKAVRFLSAFTHHMCERYPENFAGIHPGAQNSSEWFYWNGWSRPLNGYDPATLEAWRNWRADHGDPDAAYAEVPSAASRRDVSRGFLRDPVQDKDVIEFSQFQQEEMVDFIAAVARACREASDGRKLVLFFYGYPWEFSTHDQGPAVSGHLGLQRLLDEAGDCIDILCSPFSYTDRAWGGCGLAMSPAETVMRHGVLWLCEDDTRTYLEADKVASSSYGVCQTLQETQEVLRRNTAQEILRGFGCWWMDLLATGWFDSPDLWSEMSGLDRLDRALLGRQAPFRPQVAAIADERSMQMVASGTATTGRCMGMARKWLSRAGAPFGQYLMSDVLRNGLSSRMQIFQSAFCSDAETVAAISAQRSAHPEVTRVWCWAPGYLTANGPDVAGVEALTGFKVRAVSPTDAKPRATAEGRSVGLPGSWGESGVVTPLFAVETEPTDEVWATYADGSPAIVLRGKEVMVGSPDWCTELARALERRAGVHVYLRSGEASVWAAEGWLSFHALSDGALALDTGTSADVVDYFSGERISSGPLVTLRVRRGETRVLKIDSDDPVPAPIGVGSHQTGGVHVLDGETTELTGEVLLADGGVFSKTGAGTLCLPLSKVDRQVDGWGVVNHAGVLRLEAGDDETPADVPSVIAEKAALWLRADSAVVTNGTDGATRYVKRWVDVRDAANPGAPRHVYATPAWGSLAPVDNRGRPPVLVETNGTAALYFGGNESGTYMRLSSDVTDIRQSFVVHGMYDCWGAVLGNTVSRRGMIPETYKGSVAAADLKGHFSRRTELSPAYSAARCRLDGEPIDPFTTPPLAGFQLLAFEFPAQSDSVNCLFRSGFETVVDKATGADNLVQGGDYVSEIVLFTNVVSEVERLQVERYLMRRWSLPRTGDRTVAHLPAPGKVVSLAGGCVELHAESDASMPALDLQGDGTFRKTGAGTLVLGPSSATPFTGDFLWEEGAILSCGGRPPAVKASPGDRFDGAIHIPRPADLTGEPIDELKGGATLTRTTDAGSGAVVKSGNDWVRINEIADNVAAVSVDQGVLSLEAKVHAPCDCVADFPLSVTVVNGDFELPFAVTKSDGRGPLAEAGNNLNGWTGSGAYIASTNAGSVWLGDIRVAPPSGSQVLLLNLGTAASTSVDLPADGWYEMSVRAKSRFGTGASVSHKMYFQEVEVLFGSDASTLEHVGHLWPSGVGYGRYTFTLPFAKKGRHVLKFAATYRAYDGAIMLDDVEIHALTRPPADSPIKVPNGGFEQLVAGSWGAQNTGAWTGVLSPVHNQPEGWTFDTNDSVCPGAVVNGAVGVASPALSPSGDAAMVCGLGDAVEGPSRLFFFDRGGKASTTFSLPAGRYRLRADVARHNLAMRVDGGAERICEESPAFAVSVAFGGERTDLGSVSPSGFLSHRAYLPNELVVPTDQEVTLTIEQTSVRGAGWVDNLEFISSVDFSLKENLLRVPGAEEDLSTAWTMSSDPNQDGAEAGAREYDQGALTGDFGYSAFEGERYFYIRGAATMSQRVNVPAAGLYRFTCHVRTRADSHPHDGNTLRVWYKSTSGSTTNVIDLLQVPGSLNYLERSWLVRFDASGDYEIGISGQDDDCETHLDGLTLRKVSGLVDSFPRAPRRMRIAVAEGARLVLDFPGVKKVSRLCLGERKMPAGIVGANDCSDYLGGIGLLEVVPEGLVLTVR